jgi:hypothetical protein
MLDMTNGLLLAHFLIALHVYKAIRCMIKQKLVAAQAAQELDIRQQNVHSKHLGPIEGHKWFTRFPANKSLGRTVLHYLFRQNPVFTSLHLRSPFHVVPPLEDFFLTNCIADFTNKPLPDQATTHYEEYLHLNYGAVVQTL